MGYVVTIKILLDAGAEINGGAEEMWIALLRASENGYNEIE